MMLRLETLRIFSFLTYYCRLVCNYLSHDVPFRCVYLISPLLFPVIHQTTVFPLISLFSCCSVDLISLVCACICACMCVGTVCVLTLSLHLVQYSTIIHCMFTPATSHQYSSVQSHQPMKQERAMLVTVKHPRFPLLHTRRILVPIPPPPSHNWDAAQLRL